MERKKQTLKEKLDLKSIKSEAKPIIDTKEILAHPATKVVIAGVVVYGFLKVSKYFISAFSGLVKAIQEAKKNFNK